MGIGDVKERTIARKLAGVDQTYPQHAKSPTPVTRKTLPILPCAYVGPESGPKGWHYCEHPDTPLGDVVCSCKGCGVKCSGYTTQLPAPDVPVTLIDPTRLASVPDGRVFNCSMIDWKGRRLLAYRAGWTQSRLHVAELGADLQPVSSTPLTFQHPKCDAGQEDPRLFVWGDRLHVIFAGLEWKNGRLTVSQMVAELGDELQVHRVWEPRYAARTHPFEKNWMPFECGGRQYCVYSTRPHKILQIDTQTCTATLAHETAGPPDSFWSGWQLRGGAPPVRVGGEFYSFFHGWRRSKKAGTPHGDWYDYAVGVYTFEVVEPFAVKRICRHPVWLADQGKLHLNVTHDKSVIYPSSATLAGDEWLVAAGHQDAECVVGRLGRNQIESVLEAV